MLVYSLILRLNWIRKSFEVPFIGCEIRSSPFFKYRPVTPKAKLAIILKKTANGG
jgi:hypothetical protein